MKPEVFHLTFDWYHLNLTQTLSVLPGMAPCRPVPQCPLGRALGGAQSRSGHSS
jgi:hypothetical protein